MEQRIARVFVLLSPPLDVRSMLQGALVLISRELYVTWAWAGLRLMYHVGTAPYACDDYGDVINYTSMAQPKRKHTASVQQPRLANIMFLVSAGGSGWCSKFHKKSLAVKYSNRALWVLKPSSLWPWHWPGLSRSSTFVPIKLSPSSVTWDFTLGCCWHRLCITWHHLYITWHHSRVIAGTDRAWMAGTRGEAER